MPTCRSARTTLQGGSRIDVRVAGKVGGTARFRLPTLPAPPGDDILARMMSAMHALTTYRQDESLTSGLGVTVHSRYAFVAPDRFEAEVHQPSDNSEQIWIGGTRYLRQNGGKWQVEGGGPSQKVPQFIWDFFRPFVDARVLGTASVDGTRTKIVAFFGDSGSTPVWFRLWIDSSGLVHKAEMRAQGHFMDHRYYGFDQPIVIRPPAGAG